MENIKNVSFSLLVVSVFSMASFAIAQDLSPNEQLGKSIFFDDDLSIDVPQSCATCHGPAAGWTGPDTAINKGGTVYEGSISGRFGNRKPPSSAYATPSPIFHLSRSGLFIGGNFWDGRATGEKLGNPAADQAQGPFLNPMEQALPDSACIVYRVCTTESYPIAFEDVWGADACDIQWPGDIEEVCAAEGETVALADNDRAKSDAAYDNIALSIAAYEGSHEVNAFSSKYDQTFKGKAKLSQQERRGFALFRGKGMCHRCHISNGQQALFTDFTYDNLGVPRNPENPFYLNADFNPLGENWVDTGLGGFLASRIDYASYEEANLGKQKIPTLRNVGKGSCEAEPENPVCITKAYGHNGYFKSLKGIVHFYNTRDIKPQCDDPFTTEADAKTLGCWPEPEVAANVNMDELGDLGLSEDEEAAIVAFLKTLSDSDTPDN